MEALPTPAGPRCVEVKKRGIQRALAELIATYGPDDHQLSPWERHCLGAALIFLRFGYFDQAADRIARVLDPPVPLPPFPSPPALTIDDVRRQIDDGRCRVARPPFRESGGRVPDRS
ncbi:MAG: hypothetical protein KIT25_06275 [Enhydrobacter sp.]|nr:MAG: hypothetical protein KIT25_06275 [Enhydrobacter sp.]